MSVPAGIIVAPCSAAELEAVEELWPRRGCDERYRRQQAGVSTFLLAHAADEIAGRAEILWKGPRMADVAERFPDSPELNGLDVLPRVRRRGIGTALLLAAEEMARTRGCRSMGLGVGLDNPGAERIYRRLGYDGDFRYTDTYVWIDAQGVSHDAADPCRFLTKSLR